MGWKRTASDCSNLSPRRHNITSRIDSRKCFEVKQQIIHKARHELRQVGGIKNKWCFCHYECNKCRIINRPTESPSLATQNFFVSQINLVFSNHTFFSVKLFIFKIWASFPTWPYFKCTPSISWSLLFCSAVRSFTAPYSVYVNMEYTRLPSYNVLKLG